MDDEPKRILILDHPALRAAQIVALLQELEASGLAVALQGSDSIERTIVRDDLDYPAPVSMKLYDRYESQRKLREIQQRSNQHSKQAVLKMKQYGRK